MGGTGRWFRNLPVPLSEQDRWLRGLAERLAADGAVAVPRFSVEQVDRVFAHLDSGDSVLTDSEIEVIRTHLTPLWLSGGPSLREAKRDLRADLDAGTHCPCCSKWVKRYRRRLNGAVVRSLAWLVLASEDPSIADPDGWIDVPRFGPRWMLRGNPHPKLRLWRFAERKAVDDQSSVRCSGVWRPTDLGRRFARGEVDAPDSVFEYLSEVDSVSPERVRFAEVMDVEFDYRALMEWSG